jgi:hypothetical protein
MDENQTTIADEASTDVQEVFTYNFFKNKAWKWIVALSFITINGFLTIVPFITTNNTDGTVRKIPTWLLPVVVLPMYILGAFAAFFIMAWAPKLEFQGSNGPTENSFVPYSSRRWIMQYTGLKRQPLKELWRRCTTNGEKVAALRLRNTFDHSMGAGPQVTLDPMQSQINGGTAYATGAAPST